MIRYQLIAAAAAEHGLQVRGGFHPEPGDGVPSLPGGHLTRTLVLVGHTGDDLWRAFCDSGEFRDGHADPLDRWSQRVVAGLARALGAWHCLATSVPPFLPFGRWAQRCEPVHPSPMGFLIHPEYGTWHSYRGALLFEEALALPVPAQVPSPCLSCAEKPCLTSCPAGAFSETGYRVRGCLEHLESATQVCLTGGCLARRACPVGQSYGYGREAASWYLKAFQDDQSKAR